MSEGNHSIITEFRENQGKVGGYFEGKPVLILHYKGAKSGRDLETPLMYLQEGDSYVVFATMGGAPKHPDWYFNLKANPDVTIEVGTETKELRARQAGKEEGDKLYERNANLWPQFWEYRQKTTREFPVFVLEPR
jgi:deazaflavin-dependent oxidoreductase (nitroreductase family)